MERGNRAAPTSEQKAGGKVKRKMRWEQSRVRVNEKTVKGFLFRVKNGKDEKRGGIHLSQTSVLTQAGSPGGGQLPVAKQTMCSPLCLTCLCFVYFSLLHPSC